MTLFDITRVVVLLVRDVAGGNPFYFLDVIGMGGGGVVTYRPMISECGAENFLVDERWDEVD
jgi:hypothetical protein